MANLKEPTRDEFSEGEKEADEDIKRGNIKTFENADELIKYLRGEVIHEH